MSKGQICPKVKYVPSIVTSKKKHNTKSGKDIFVPKKDKYVPAIVLSKFKQTHPKQVKRTYMSHKRTNMSRIDSTFKNKHITKSGEDIYVPKKDKYVPAIVP